MGEDREYQLKSAVDALSKQAQDRLKSKGDPRAVNHLVERYNFLLKMARELNLSNILIQSSKEIPPVPSNIATMGEYTTKMEEVTFALTELDSQLSYPVY